MKSGDSDRMVPLKALQEERAKARKLRTRVDMLEAEKAGWFVERERLVGLLSPSRDCPACATSRRAGHEP